MSQRTDSSLASSTTGATDVVDLSQRLLLAVKSEEGTEALESTIATLDHAVLERALATPGDTMAFWLNIYNAFVQILLSRSPSLYNKKLRFYSASRIPVAGRNLSLDDIEHGMLRRSQLKWGLGYIPHPFPSGFERALRVDDRDPRIHFALNCGARSCPPIAVYSPERIDDELDIATESYLSQEVTYDPDRNVARVPRLFLWFRGDFGGKSGIVAMLREHDLVPEDATPRLKHKSYDWTMELGQYREQST